MLKYQDTVNCLEVVCSENKNRSPCLTCMICRFSRSVSSAVDGRLHFSEAAVGQHIPTLRPPAGRDTSSVCYSSSDHYRHAGSTCFDQCRLQSLARHWRPRQRGGSTGHCGLRDVVMVASCYGTGRGRREASFAQTSSYPSHIASLYTRNRHTPKLCVDIRNNKQHAGCSTFQLLAIKSDCMFVITRD